MGAATAVLESALSRVSKAPPNDLPELKLRAVLRGETREDNGELILGSNHDNNWSNSNTSSLFELAGRSPNIE